MTKVSGRYETSKRLPDGSTIHDRSHKGVESIGFVFL